MSDISDQIETNARAPRQVTVDGSTAQQHSLPDQIAADKYLGQKGAITSGNLGMRLTKFNQPGVA